MVSGVNPPSPTNQHPRPSFFAATRAPYLAAKKPHRPPPKRRRGVGSLVPAPIAPGEAPRKFVRNLEWYGSIHNVMNHT